MRRFGLLGRIAAATVICLGLPGAASAGPEVDVALVLAVDISYSMDPEEQRLQRDGYVAAFRSAPVVDAIGRGALGRIAVSYVEWAGESDQRVVVPWTILDTPGSVEAFAADLAGKPTRRSFWTSISAAIDFSARLLAGSDIAAIRQVIDVSGDGPNNQGRPVVDARADAVGRGITINGLPLQLKEPTGRWDMRDLDLYYRECVIGGPGAFLVPVRAQAEFADAIRTKIVREIASAEPVRLPIEPAVLEYGGNCRAGERSGGSWQD